MALSVTSVNPACGSHLPTNSPRQTSFTVFLSAAVNAGTVDASDFKVDGNNATTAAPSGTQITFTFATSPITWLGTHVMSVPAGGFTQLSDGSPVGAFSCNVFWDLVPKPNIFTVPCKDGDGNPANVVNAARWERPTGALGSGYFLLNWFDMLCIDGVGNYLVLINAGLYARHFVPGLTSGIHNPEAWGQFEFGPGYVGQPYAQEWYLANLKQPVVFSVVAGAPPPGLELTNVGATARGRISGIPTEEGEFVFVLRALGPDVDALKPFSILIYLIPPRVGDTSHVGGN